MMKTIVLAVLFPIVSCQIKIDFGALRGSSLLPADIPTSCEADGSQPSVDHPASRNGGPKVKCPLPHAASPTMAAHLSTTMLTCSGSIGAENFERLKCYLRSLAAAAGVGPGASRIGLVQFATGADVEFPFSHDPAFIYRKIKDMRWRWGNTDIFRGMDLARERLLSPANRRPGVSPVVIVFTDGNPSWTPPTRAASKKLLDMGIPVYAVGIGDKVGLPALDVIVGARTERIAKLSGFRGLLPRGARETAAMLCRGSGGKMDRSEGDEDYEEYREYQEYSREEGLDRRGRRGGSRSNGRRNGGETGRRGSGGRRGRGRGRNRRRGTSRTSGWGSNRSGRRSGTRREERRNRGQNSKNGRDRSDLPRGRGSVRVNIGSSRWGEEDSGRDRSSSRIGSDTSRDRGTTRLGRNRASGSRSRGGPFSCRDTDIVVGVDSALSRRGSETGRLDFLLRALLPRLPPSDFGSRYAVFNVPSRGLMIPGVLREFEDEQTLGRVREDVLEANERSGSESWRWLRRSIKDSVDEGRAVALLFFASAHGPPELPRELARDLMELREDFGVRMVPISGHNDGANSRLALEKLSSSGKVLRVPFADDVIKAIGCEE